MPVRLSKPTTLHRPFLARLPLDIRDVLIAISAVDLTLQEDIETLSAMRHLLVRTQPYYVADKSIAINFTRSM